MGFACSLLSLIMKNVIFYVILYIVLTFAYYLVIYIKFIIVPLNKITLFED